MKLVYSNTPWGPKTIDDSVMEKWNFDDWKKVLDAAGCVPDPVAYEPTFLDAFISVPNGIGGVIRQSIGAGEGERFNSLFATKATALEMAKRFGSSPEVREIDPGYGGGAVLEPAKAFGIQVKDGRVLNAGMLASVYVRFQATGNQAMADQFIARLIASGT